MNMWKPDHRVFTEYNTCKQDVFCYGVLENCILIRAIKVLKWTITVMLTMFVDVTKVTVYFKKSFLFCHSTALEPNTWLKVIKLIFTPFTNFVHCLNCIHNVIVNLHELLYKLCYWKLTLQPNNVECMTGLELFFNFFSIFFLGPRLHV